MRPKRVGLVGFDRVTALQLVGPAEAFSAAALDNGFGGRIPCYDVTIVGVGSTQFVTESGVIFTAAADLESAPEFDTILVAGGSGIREPEVADTIADWLLDRAGETQRLGAVCTGIYGVAPTGLLDGHEVTVHWRAASDLARRFPRLRVNHKKPLIQTGPYWTSSGLSAGINLSLAMIREDYGPYVSQSVSRDLLLAASGDPDRQEQPVRTSTSANYPMDRFADLVAWIVRNLDADLSVEALAKRACICPTHFSRAFKSVFGEAPTEFVENLRLNEARRRLTKRQKTLQSVASSVGFRNTTTFQRAFERRFGTRPSNLLEPRAKRSSPADAAA
jgi:transcriptional regulator GlxA family with amidase domain